MEMVRYFVEDCEADLDPMASRSVSMTTVTSSMDPTSPLSLALVNNHFHVAQYLAKRRKAESRIELGVYRALMAKIWKAITDGETAGCLCSFINDFTDSETTQMLADAALLWAVTHRKKSNAMQHILEEFDPDPGAYVDFGGACSSAIDCVIADNDLVVLKILLAKTPATSTALARPRDLVETLLHRNASVALRLGMFELLHFRGVRWLPCTLFKWLMLPLLLRRDVAAAMKAASQRWSSANLQHKWMPSTVRHLARTAALCLLRCGLPRLVRDQILCWCRDPTRLDIDRWLVVDAPKPLLADQQTIWDGWGYASSDSLDDGN